MKADERRKLTGLLALAMGVAMMTDRKAGALPGDYAAAACEAAEALVAEVERRGWEPDLG